MMAVKVNTLTEAEIRSIGDAFADHAYADGEFGMRCIFYRNRSGLSLRYTVF